MTSICISQDNDLQDAIKLTTKMTVESHLQAAHEFIVNVWCVHMVKWAFWHLSSGHLLIALKNIFTFL